MIKFCMEEVTSSDTGHFWINWYDDVDSMFVGQLHITLRDNVLAEISALIGESV